MFPSAETSPVGRRVRNALSLARSFLLLEDDYDVDWEVDGGEPGQGETCADAHHPHRALLRARPITVERRRRGQPAAPAQLCLCPVGGPAGVTPPSGVSHLERPRARPERAPSCAGVEASGV